MSGRFFVDVGDQQVYETVVTSGAGDVFLSQDENFFWAIEQLALCGPLSLAQAASGAELGCFSGGDIVFKIPLAVLARGPALVNIVIPPRQPMGLVIYGDSDCVLEVKVRFKWRTASESEWEPPEMPDIEGA